MSNNYVKRNDIKVYWTDVPVNMKLIPQRIHLTDKEKSMINDYWEKESSYNSSLYNGEVLCAENLFYYSNGICMNIKISDYAHYVYMMNHIEENITVCRSLSAGALIITSDEYIVLGKMGKKTSFPGIIHCIGGGMAIMDIIGIEPLANTVSTECYEEIGIKLNRDNFDINKKYICFRGKESTIGLCYIVNLSISKEELERHFNTYKSKNDEIEELYFVVSHGEQVREFCKQDMIIDYLKYILYDYVGIEYLHKWSWCNDLY